MRTGIRKLAPVVALTIGFLAVGLLAVGVVHSGPKPGQQITVRVLRAKVMKAPRFIGSTAGSVSRGDQLTVREVKGDWYRVEGPAEGWIHRTSVLDKKVELSTKPGAAGGDASREEVELAGRGFTPQVEKEYRDKNLELDFSHVDAIEAIEMDTEGLLEFVEEGELEGGR